MSGPNKDLAHLGVRHATLQMYIVQVAARLHELATDPAGWNDGQLVTQGHIGQAVGIALAIGVFGYHFIAGLSWVDSLLNASMILGGMGPVDPLRSSAAKIFASCYALFSGLAFVGIAGLMIGPFAHRLLHRFHIEGK